MADASPAPNDASRPVPARSRTIRDAAIVALLAALVALPLLGRFGLRSTEGHRVIPALEVLASGDLVPTTMFDAVYLRKPPGAPWAIAASVRALGEHEFAMRLPSALAFVAMALAAWWFARRWFGSSPAGKRWALAAGVAQALFPALWPMARAAEIEALNQLATQLTALLLIDCFVRRAAAHRPLTHSIVRTAAIALAFLGVLLMKGPASVPALLGVIAGCAVAARSVRALRAPQPWIGLALGAAGFAGVAWWIARAAAGQDAITQSAGAFVFNLGRLADAAAFAPMCIATALPLALLALFPFGPDAERETRGSNASVAPTELHIARALAWSFLLGVAGYALLLIANPRYGFPTYVTLPPLAAYVFRGVFSARAPFMPKRRSIGRWLALGSRWSWPGVLIVGWFAWVAVAEPRRGGDSGRAPGIALAAHLPDGAVVYANGAIEARPETLYYARRAAAADGRTVRALWAKRELAEPRALPAGAYLLLRPNERRRLAAEHPGLALRELAWTDVHVYRFGLFRLDADAAGSAAP